MLKYYKNEVSEAIEGQKWGKMRVGELVSGGYGNEMKEDVGDLWGGVKMGREKRNVRIKWGGCDGYVAQKG